MVQVYNNPTFGTHRALQKATERVLRRKPATAKPVMPGHCPISANQIRQIDPATIKPVKPETLPKATDKPATASPERKPFWTKTKAAVAAGAATMLTPALALAAGGGAASAVSGFFSSVAGLYSAIGLGPVGLFLAGAGMLYLIRLGYQRNKELQSQNLQTLESRANTGNPTPKRLLKTLVLPTLGASLGVGALMQYLPEILLKTLGSESILGGVFGIQTVAGLPVTSVTWEACWLVAGLLAARTIAFSVKHIYQEIKYRVKGEQAGNLRKENIWAQLLTNVFANGAMFANAVFMAHMSKIFATQFIFMTMNFLRGAAITVTTAATLPVMLKYAAFFGLAAAVYRYGIGWLKSAIGNLSEKIPSRAFSTLKWAIGGAAAGAAVSLVGFGLAANNLLTGAVALAFAHNFIHSSRSQEGGLNQMMKLYLIFDLHNLFKVVRSRWGDARTVFKPGINMVDPLTSAYIMGLIGEGPNDIISAIAGYYSSDEYIKGQQMIDCLFNSDLRIMRGLIRNGYKRMNAADTREDALEAVASVYRDLSHFFVDDSEGYKEYEPLHGGNPRCLGNLKAISGLPYLKDNLFSTGLPEKKSSEDILAHSEYQRGDQDLRTHGELIRFQALWDKLNAHTLPEADYKDATLQSIKELFTEHLEAMFIRSYKHADTHPCRFWENDIPDDYNAKQTVMDLAHQKMAHHVGITEVVVLKADGTIAVRSAPMRAVRDLAPDYKERLSIEGSEATGINRSGIEEDLEDLRFEWYEREIRDIGPSNWEVRYVDNTAHFRKYKSKGGLEFLRAYPTAEVNVPPLLKKESQYDHILKKEEPREFLDVVYTNGVRQRVYADGSSITIAGKRVVRGKEEEQCLPSDYAILMLPQTQRHEFVADMLQSKRAFPGIPVEKIDKKALKRLKQGDVPSPWGGSFSKDPYLAPRWHHFYPTEVTSVSDADQMDKKVTNERLQHYFALPHLRMMFVRPKTENLPFPERVTHLFDSEDDSFNDARISLTWMITRVRLTDGSYRWIPLNMNKESFKTFGSEVWRLINEEVPLEIVETEEGYKLRISYAPKADEIDLFQQRKDAITEVDMPMEMLEFVDRIEEDGIRLFPIRHGEVGGPIPVCEYRINRRTHDGKFTDSSRTLKMSEQVAQIIMDASDEIYREEEIDHMEKVSQKAQRHKFAWADKKGFIHISMNEEEYREMQDWLALAPYHGEFQPKYKNGELLMDVDHFEVFRHRAYWEFTYRRYMPDYYRPYFEPSETTPWRPGDRE